MRKKLIQVEAEAGQHILSFIEELIIESVKNQCDVTGVHNNKYYSVSYDILTDLVVKGEI